MILMTKEDPWEGFEQAIGEFTEDYLEGERIQPPLEEGGIVMTRSAGPWASS